MEQVWSVSTAPPLLDLSTTPNPAHLKIPDVGQEVAEEGEGEGPLGDCADHVQLVALVKAEKPPVSIASPISHHDQHRLTQSTAFFSRESAECPEYQSLV